MTARINQISPRSRRALLAGAIGGLGVWAASAIGRAAPAEAAAGDPIRMGRLNLASSTATTLQTKTSRAALLVNQLGVGAAVKGVSHQRTRDHGRGWLQTARASGRTAPTTTGYTGAAIRARPCMANPFPTA